VAEPLVSIIIDNYNYSRFLGAAVDSAIAQTYPNVEVIVVDDGSTDNSREIIAGYGTGIVPIFKANGGQASAFNAGFAASRGEVIIFLDSDDVLFPEAVERVLEVFEPGTAKIQYPLVYIDESGRRSDRIWAFAPMSAAQAASFSLFVCLGNGPPTSGNVFSRDVLLKLLPIPEAEWRICADAYLNLLSPFCGGDFYNIDEALAGYRLHSSNNWLREKVDLDERRRLLSGQVKCRDALAGFLERQGIVLPEDWLLRNPWHVGGRLYSLRIGTGEHPFPEDRRWELLIRGVRGSWTSPLFDWKHRLLYPIYLLALAAVPTALLPTVFELKQRLRARASTT
jgi:glycosyltransferase involved in cell wall biosynthesis